MLKMNLILCLIITGLFSCKSQDIDKKVSMHELENLPVENAILTKAPLVPPPITRNHSAKVIVNLETSEGVAELSKGVQYVFWRFGDSVPGPMIRVREGDYIELNFSNHPKSKLPHNIDLHAVTGQGGGAEATFTLPGKTSKMNFRAMKPGLYVYHCATAPVGMHIANGMYGLILVQPKEGFEPVDKEFYIMQSEFYTKGKYNDKGLQPFSLEKALQENPDYVVFNGSVGALTGKNALKAKTGETIRMYVGVGGPNLSSSFHVIGEIFDKVYVDAGTKIIQENVQTTLIPSGGSTIVEFKVDVPATYVLVDHAIFRAFNKGAIGQLIVEGEHDETIITEKLSTTDYKPSVEEKKEDNKKPDVSLIQKSLKEQMNAGAKIYELNCLPCHGEKGEGLEGEFPPLAKSDYLLKDKNRSIDVVMNGLTGKIKVNGKEYDSEMPNLELSDEEISDVLTYVRNSFGNKAGPVLLKEVKQRRK